MEDISYGFNAADLKPGDTFILQGKRKRFTVSKILDGDKPNSIGNTHSLLKGKFLIIVQNCRQILLPKDSTVTKVMKVTDVTEGMPTSCAYCGAKKEKDGSTIDLRPYGRDGAWICFACGMKPENRETTDQMFAGVINGNDVTITGG